MMRGFDLFKEDFTMVNVNPALFQWHSPKPKSALAITVPNQNNICFNSKLTAVLPPAVEIGISPDGRMLALRQKEGGYRVPRSSAVKARDLVQILTNAGVHLPARYTVELQGNLWIGVLEEKEQNLPKAPPRKPKKSKPGRSGAGTARLWKMISKNRPCFCFCR